MHRILERQIKRVFGEHFSIPPQWGEFLQLISETYTHLDEDRALLNRSLEISSKEFLENNQRLEETKIAVEEQAKNLALEVAKRTKELSARIAELEDARRAMTNLLEDIEVEKRKKEVLTQDLEKFKLAVDNVSDTIIITDPEGLVIYANKAVEKITGYKPQEAIGKKSGALWKTPMPQAYYQKLWDTMKNQKKVFISEMQNKRKNGQVYTTAISISPIVNKSGEIKFFVGIERDITREKEIDKAKTEFVSLASHQLRTPLSTVSWYTEMLLAGDAGTVNEQQKKYLDEVYRGNRRMVELVDALLSVSRLELGTFAIESEPTDVVKLVRSVIDEQKTQIDERKIQLRSVFNPAILLIPTDPKLLHMIVENLLSNAIKYTPEGGKVEMEIALTDDKGQKPPTTFSHILLKVSDTGYGIPQDQQDMIFTKLFRADNVREKDTQGTGLGLYIVKSVIDHVGGKIWFESQEEKGTTFYVTLPMIGMRQEEGTTTLV